MAEESTALPAGVRLLWGLDKPRGGDPSLRFSLDEVVAAAIEVADTEGLAAVSMARVAQQLGSSTMALYRYVASKDDLLLLMSDAAIGPPPVLRGRRSGAAGCGSGRWPSARSGGDDRGCSSSL